MALFATELHVCASRSRDPVRDFRISYLIDIELICVVLLRSLLADGMIIIEWAESFSKIPPSS